MGENIMDVVGAEVVGIVCPVSICMWLVVLLVKVLQTEVTDTVLTSVASLIYSEDSSDSDWTKFLGALINAGVFVLLITLVTFLLVLLFYYRCTKCLRVYTAIGAFTILAYMGGSISVMLIQELAVPIDAITGLIILYNFAIVGVLAMFFSRVPILVTQGYLILVGTTVAFWFTSLPEWTTWVLLVAISLYDIVAVLTPGGPLNILVQMAMSRDEEIPALIYEARPLMAVGQMSSQAMTPTTHAHAQADLESSPLRNTLEEPKSRFWKRSTTPGFSGALSNLRTPFLEREAVEGDGVVGSSQRLHSVHPDMFSTEQNVHTDMTPPFREEMQGSDNTGQSVDLERMPLVHDERTSLVYAGSMRNVAALNGSDVGLAVRNDGTENGEAINDDDEGIGLGASGAIKLGLGDFIFYSVLVGRAALYDMTTVYACYLAIIFGLGATLGLLAVWRRALPALPISIALGVVFYFLTRLLMEPFIMGYGGNLIFL